MDKLSLRREMHDRRMAVTKEERSRCAALFTRMAEGLLRGQPFSAVAGYFPVRGEMEVMPLLKMLQEHGKTVTLPAMQTESRVLSFRRWQPGMTLVKNRIGIAEPPPEAPEATPDIILTPLLAFDDQGNRLGYGGGYYDATRAALPQTIAIGCAYDWQRVESVPVEPHDRLLDWIITEKSVRRRA